MVYYVNVCHQQLSQLDLQETVNKFQYQLSNCHSGSGTRREPQWSLGKIFSLSLA